jgi:uncharacterized LabA/DUF88 family protein
MERVVAYIDGFNLYYGMREMGWQRYYWLDVGLLMRNLLKTHQALASVFYFTARVSATRDDPDKPRRQNTYLEALTAVGSIKIQYGHYIRRHKVCLRCGVKWVDHEEKGTDANIAVRMLLDAFDDEFDTALLVSADSDLVGPIQTIRGRFPRKKIVVVFPPKRQSVELKRVASAWSYINRVKLAKSQLPERIPTPSGTVLKRPPSWA